MSQTKQTVMIDKPISGWTRITIRSWDERCKCDMETIKELIDALDHAYRNHRTSVVKLSSGSYDYLLIFMEYSVMIIYLDVSYPESPVQITIPIQEVTEGLVTSFVQNKDDWDRACYDGGSGDSAYLTYATFDFSLSMLRNAIKSHYAGHAAKENTYSA